MTDVPVGYPKLLRQSLLSTADTCLHRLKWYLDPATPYYAGVSRMMGTGYHAGLEFWYGALKNGEIVKVEQVLYAARQAMVKEISDAGKNFDWTYQVKTARQAERILTKDEAFTMVFDLLRTYVQEGYTWPVERYVILDIELEFLLPYPGFDEWRRKGAIDLVLWDRETKWIHIVDHKTAKKKWPKNKSQAHYTPQAAYYTKAFEDLLAMGRYSDLEVAGITFTYDVFSFNDSHFARIDAYRTPAQVAATMKRADMLVQLIENGGPLIPSPDSFLCQEAYCDYWDECEHGKTLHEVH